MAGCCAWALRISPLAEPTMAQCGWAMAAAALARFELREQLRQDAAATLAALAAQGLRLHLLSGDSLAAVQRFAHALGDPFASQAARLLPQDKLERVRALQSQGRVVAMVGDGINDAPVLAGADVSIALGEGAALAQQAADFVVVSPSLLRIAAAARTARRTRAVIRQNLALGRGLQPGGIAAGCGRPGHAVGGGAGDGTLVADRDIQRAAACRTGTHMNILLLLIPLSLVLLVAAIYAFIWAVRNDQFEQLDTPALDILNDRAPEDEP